MRQNLPRDLYSIWPNFCTRPSTWVLHKNMMSFALGEVSFAQGWPLGPIPVDQPSGVNTPNTYDNTTKGHTTYLHKKGRMFGMQRWRNWSTNC